MEMTRRTFVAGASLTLGAVASSFAPAVPTIAWAEEDAEQVEADLVVVGAGAAGLAAAAKAAEGGATVVVLEAMESTGGTTKICGGHWKYIDDDFMSKLPPRTEESDDAISEVLHWNPEDFGDYAEACRTCQADVETYLASDSALEFDSVEYWLCLHYLGTRGVDLDGMEAVADYDVVAPSYYASGEVAQWIEGYGLQVSDPQPNNRGDGGPLSIEPEGQGFGLIQALETMARDAGAEIVLNAKAVELASDEETGRVVAVIAEHEGTRVRYSARCLVLLACGGYCSNPEMVARQNCFTGIDATVPSCEPAACDGAGIEMAQALGAATANMSFVQFFGFPLAQMGSIETLFGKIGASKFLCNLDGKRFCDDSRAFFGGGAMEDVRPICDQPSGRYFLIGDAEGVTALGQEYDDDLAAGIVVQGDTPDALADASGFDADGFTATLEAWNSYVDDGEDPDFGRDMEKAARVEVAPLLSIPMAAYAQNTMGGLVINSQGQVMAEDGNPIEGLYAAGEVTGNLDGACRRHGDNFAQILYYGWLAGKTAAEMSVSTH